MKCRTCKYVDYIESQRLICAHPKNKNNIESYRQGYFVPLLPVETRVKLCAEYEKMPEEWGT